MLTPLLYHPRAQTPWWGSPSFMYMVDIIASSSAPSSSRLSKKANRTGTGFLRENPPYYLCTAYSFLFLCRHAVSTKGRVTTDDDVNPVCGTNTTCWPIDRQVAKWLPNVPSPPPAVAAARRRNLLLGAARPNVHHACGGVCVLRPPASS